MFMAIAVESSKHPKMRDNYKVWYLEIDDFGNVVDLGIKTKEQLVQGLFSNIKSRGKSKWRAFLKGKEESKEIELVDFISQNKFENTHFGNLPSISEFQQTLNYLKMNLEVKAVA